MPNPRNAVETLIEELKSMPCPSHLTMKDLEKIDRQLEYGTMTIYKFKQAIKLITPKPPQSVRFMTIPKCELDKKTMFDWRGNKHSVFVEIRLDNESGERLMMSQWSEIERTNDEVLVLAGVRI